MKPLFLLLLVIMIASAASAQDFKTDLKKELKQQPLTLQKVDVRTPVLQPGITLSPGVYKLPQDNMLCLVPNTQAIVFMPNALPELTIPGVAAIPNPATGKGLQKAEIVHGSK